MMYVHNAHTQLKAFNMFTVINKMEIKECDAIFQGISPQ